MTLIAVAVVFGFLTFLSMVCSAICFILDQDAIGVFFGLLAFNFFRPFASTLAKVNAESPNNSWQYVLLASPEGLLLLGLLLVISLLYTLYQFFRSGGVAASKARAKHLKDLRDMEGKLNDL